MKLRLARRLGAVGGVLAVAAIGWFLFTSGEHVTSERITSEEAPFGEMDDFVYTRSQAGQVQWQMKAERARYFLERKEVLFDHVDGVLHQDGREIQVQSRKGRLDLNAQQESKGPFDLNVRLATLEDEVRGQTSDGLHLQTTMMHIDGQKKQVYTDRLIRVEGSNFDLEGTGFVLDMEKQTMRLNNLDQSEQQLLEPPATDRPVPPPMKATWWSQEKP